MSEDDALEELAEALELRDELLIACRDVLAQVGNPHAAALVKHIDHLLDLDDGVPPPPSTAPGR